MSLQRILEPEVMDSAEEASSYDEMDHSTVNQQFVDDLLAFRQIDGDVLDMGCGTAQLPVLLCQQSPARIMAMDLSVQMLDIARYNIEAASLIDRIQLVHADAKATQMPDGEFDAVISNSIIHHIPTPQDTLQEAARLVRSDGVLFFRDLMRPADQETLDRIVEEYAGSESEHARQMFRDSLHAALSLEEIRELVAAMGFDPETVTATSDRHWTWAAAKSS